MTAEQRTIDPSTVVTRVAEQVIPSRSGMPRRRMVTVGQTPDGIEHILLGSARQVEFFIDVERQANFTPIVDANQIFRLQDDHPADEMLREEGVKATPVTQLRDRITHGADLVEGVFAVVNRPGQPSITVDDTKGIWTPAAVAMGDTWKLA